MGSRKPKVVNKVNPDNEVRGFQACSSMTVVPVLLSLARYSLGRFQYSITDDMDYDLCDSRETMTSVGVRPSPKSKASID